MSPIKAKILIIAIILTISLFFIYKREQIYSAVDAAIGPDFLNNHPTIPSKDEIVPATSITNNETLDNLLRTQAQCIEDFPDLYDSIDTSVSHYRDQFLQRADLERPFEGHEVEFTWVVIRNNQVYVRHRHGGFQSRVQAVPADLHRAVVTSPERLPDIEFIFNTADSAPGETYTPIFGLSRGLDERAFPIPDFGYWAWPEPLVYGYTEFENQVDRVEEEVPWQKKKNRLFWRGNVNMNPERKYLVKISEQNNETWGNAQNIDWGELKEGDRYDMADHCRFKFVAHIEGARYSARLKYLQHCNSVIVTHRQKWTTHLSHLFPMARKPNY
jgi:hypothetical protein